MAATDLPQKSARMSETAKNEFSMAVEKKAIDMRIPYKTALTLVMLECSIEPEQIKKMINKSLYDKIEAECIEDRTIKGAREKGATNLVDKFSE